MIARLGVVGGGQMGQGIAQVAAQAGLDVVLVDVTPELAAAAIAKLGKTLDKLVDKGKLAAEARDAARARLRAGAGHGDLADREFVIEAAPEHEALKLELMRSLAKVTPAETILASNTSSISITKLAAASGRPDRVIGMHFMNPVPVMKLVEVVRTLLTDDGVLAEIDVFCRALGKTPVACKDNSGFRIASRRA